MARRTPGASARALMLAAPRVLSEWEQHRSIPWRTKIVAIACMVTTVTPRSASGHFEA